MPAEGRGTDLRQARKVLRSRRLANGPATPLERVRKLQTPLQAKAKAEPAFRFYALWDKVCRSDVPEEAYRACRRNGGALGCDGTTFDQITAHGVDRWLEELRQELLAGRYQPKRPVCFQLPTTARPRRVCTARIACDSLRSTESGAVRWTVSGLRGLMRR
jgi:hypothetical protein